MTPDQERSARSDAGDDQEPEPTLLGEVLALAPRLASRTIAQIQASQQLLSLMGCSSDARTDAGSQDGPASSPAMAEPVDVLAVLGDDDTGDTGDTGDVTRDASMSRNAAAVEEVQGSGPAETFAPFAGTPETPKVDNLAIPGYDSLAASQVVPRLTTLGPDELGAIGSYEQANRGRRTILNRVTQLLNSADGNP